MAGKTSLENNESRKKVKNPRRTVEHVCLLLTLFVCCLLLIGGEEMVVGWYSTSGIAMVTSSKRLLTMVFVIAACSFGVTWSGIKQLKIKQHLLFHHGTRSDT